MKSAENISEFKFTGSRTFQSYISNVHRHVSKLFGNMLKLEHYNHTF